MIRKTVLIATGIAIGAGCATLGQQARAVIGGPALAASADTYKNLSLFGDVFDKVRADYVEKPDEQKLVENAINGMLSHLDPHPLAGPRGPFWGSRRELPRFPPQGVPATRALPSRW